MCLLDGRDVPETSALDYVVPFEAFLGELSTGGFDARIASGGGRQYITMDRYDANWAMVEKGWKTHVLGVGAQFPNATAAVNGLREQKSGHHRSGFAGIRHCRKWKSDWHHRGWRFGRVLQFPG
jgi:2,3-bisphosphoglycerate-independent phosphoglycerate mutase